MPGEAACASVIAQPPGSSGAVRVEAELPRKYGGAGGPSVPVAGNDMDAFPVGMPIVGGSDGSDHGNGPATPPAEVPFALKGDRAGSGGIFGAATHWGPPSS